MIQILFAAYAANSARLFSKTCVFSVNIGNSSKCARSIDNFAEDSRPSSNGAWIVRNSWGDKEEYTLPDLKKEIFIF